MLVHVTSYGQLGNRLQLFAHLIAFGIENNIKIMNLGFKEYSHLFVNTDKDMFCRYPAENSFIRSNSLRTFVYKLANYLAKKKSIKNLSPSFFKLVQCFPFSDNESEFRLDNKEFLQSIRNTKIIATNGYYFVDYVNFLKHADKIRQHFIPLQLHEYNIDRLIQTARQQCDVLIGLHIRRDDYKTFQGGKFYYDTEVFIKLMQQAENIFPENKVRFLICSDESQNKNEFSNFQTTFGTNQIVEDMYSLARCDYIIGPPSTYSRWACFFGNTPVYHIIDPGADLSIYKFKTYDDIVHFHMQTAPQFPKL